MSDEHNNSGEATEAKLHDLLAAARDALCGCGKPHGIPQTTPGSEWAAVPIQCGTIIHHTFARLLNYWYVERPRDIDDYLEAAAFGFAKAGPGDAAGHVGASMLRILSHWFEIADPHGEGDYWGDLTDADRHRFVHALAGALHTFEDALDPAGERPEAAGDVPAPVADALTHLRAAAAALGLGASNIGLAHMPGADRAYIEAVTLAAVMHGRLAALTTLIGGDASRQAQEIAQNSYPVAAVGAASASDGIESERMAAAALLGSHVPLARWFEARADTVPRAGAVWRLLAAASLLNHADTIADAAHEGYADRLANFGDGDESGSVADALELIREVITSIELETR